MILKDLDKRAEHNIQKLQAMIERLKAPSKREHNCLVLKKYGANRTDIKIVPLNISFRYLNVQLSFDVAVDVFISGYLLLF